MGIVDGLFGADEAHIDTPEVGPCIEMVGCELCPVVHLDGSQSAAVLDHAIECLGDRLRSKALRGLQSRAFSSEAVDDYEHPNHSPVRQRVGGEGYTPTLIDCALQLGVERGRSSHTSSVA